MVLPLFSFPEVPNEKIALIGRLASAALVILLSSIVFPLFPDVSVVVLKFRMPPVASVVEPLIVQYFTTLDVASLMKRMVEVPAVDAVLLLVIIRSFVLPVAFTLPSMVTLSAPFRSIRGEARLPFIVSPVVVG